MRNRPMRSLLMVGVLVIAVPDRPDRNPNDTRPLAEQLQGEWLMVNSVLGGVSKDFTMGNGAVYTFTRDRLLTRNPKQPAPVSFGITLDTTRTPAFIDFLAGSAEPKTNYPGIFKIEADTLTLCFTRAVSGERPAEYASRTDTPNTALYQFRRLQK
ncbi:MAG: TIGR03067 domain-containing protein [Gemmataceae bacterium]|nr:TIGR03067 domain-containing protein [Gemmataceae bacterium]